MAFLPLAAIAQQHAAYSPDDPSAPTGNLRYESAFTNYRAESDVPSSPDKGWRAANDAMGKLGGHAGHVRVDAGAPQSQKIPTENSDKPEPAQTVAPADHSKHH